MKPFAKVLLIGGAVLGGYLILKPKAAALPPAPPMPQPVPPPRPGPSPSPPPSPRPSPEPSPYPSPTPGPRALRYSVGSRVKIADAVQGTVDMVVVEQNPGDGYDYRVVTADCMPNPLIPITLTCTPYYVKIMESDIIS